MKCPNCNNEVVDYLDFCYVCDYLFDSYFEKLYVDITGKFICSIIIEETINNYFNTPIKSYKTRHIDSKIIFKNISTDNIFQTFPTNLSPEEFTINFYKQKGYNAFFAENNYWIILFSMIYDYKNFISYPHYFELISRNLHDTDIDKIDFNSIKNIHIASRIIKAYFKSICPIIPPHEMYNHENYSSGLQTFF